jgi:hypothetical protein
MWLQCSKAVQFKEEGASHYEFKQMCMAVLVTILSSGLEKEWKLIFDLCSTWTRTGTHGVSKPRFFPSLVVHYF